MDDFDVFIACEDSARDDAREVTQLLRSGGARVFNEEDVLPIMLIVEMPRALTRSSIMLLFATNQYGSNVNTLKQLDIADVIMGNRISQDQAAGNALGTTPFVLPILYDNQEVQPHVVGVVNQEHGLVMAEGAQAISTSIMAMLNLPVVQPMHWFTASESQKLVDTAVLTVLSTEFPEKLELDTDFWQEIRGALQSHRTPLSLKRRFRNIVGAVNLDDVENDVFHLTEFVTLGLVTEGLKERRVF